MLLAIALICFPRCKGQQTVTDVDFVAYDRQTGELSVFQLKWQQPVGIDPKRRRSAGGNLLTECNLWIQRIEAWCAVWADWAHFKKVCCENPSASVLELADILAAEIREAQAGIEKESFAIPLPDLAVIVNPVKVPAVGKHRTADRG